MNIVGEDGQPRHWRAREADKKRKVLLMFSLLKYIDTENEQGIKLESAHSERRTRASLCGGLICGQS